jgi:hypothetical protein
MMNGVCEGDFEALVVNWFFFNIISTERAEHSSLIEPVEHVVVTSKVHAKCPI